MPINPVQIQIEANFNGTGTEQAKQSLSSLGTRTTDVGKTADDAAGRFQSFGTSLQRVAEIALGINLYNLGYQISDSVKRLVTFGVDSASQIEQTRITMDAFTGSVEKGQRAMEIMNAFARSAPLIPLQDVQQSSEQILGFGFTLDQLKEKLQVAGELSIAAHEPMSVAVDLLARAKEGIFNLREFGQFGISAEELTKFGIKLKETGGVVKIMNKKDLLPALEALANTKFGSIFQKEEGTFAGAVQNIKDDAMRISAAILGIDESGNIKKGSLYQELEKDATRLYAYVDAHKEDIANSLKGAANAMMNLGNFLVNTLIPDISNLYKFISEHKGILTELEAVLITMGLVALPGLALGLWGAALAFGGLLLAMGPIPWTVFAIVELATLLITHWGDVVKFFDGTLIPIIAKVGDWLDWLVNKAIDSINTVINLANSVGSLTHLPQIPNIPHLPSHTVSPSSAVSNSLGGFLGSFAPSTGQQYGPANPNSNNSSLSPAGSPAISIYNNNVFHTDNQMQAAAAWQSYQIANANTRP